MKNTLLELALNKLAKQFETLPWEYNTIEKDGQREIVRLWPGKKEEEIMIAVLKAYDFYEELHRQDYYFFNYAYKHSYQTISDRRDNIITINEGECYVGQPFCGYGIRQPEDTPAIVIGVLIQKELFYRDFLPIVSSCPAIFDFFIDPQRNYFSTDYLRFSFPKDSPVKTLLEMMVMEYADPQDETPEMLKSMTGTLLLQIARRYRIVAPTMVSESKADQIIGYMSEHMDSATLPAIGKHFSYHPTYVSNLLKKETGSTFSELLLKLRMERAVMLLNGTTLSIEEIAAMLGYSNSSNFYKAFKAYYGTSPREHVKL